MTDPVSLGVSAVAAGVAAAIGWLWWPRAPELDGERWFKALFAVQLRGITERSGGGASDWETSVIRFIPWHPAGRFPEKKVANPIVARLPAAALPGELELLDALARLPDPASRWRRMYEEDPLGRTGRLADPIELGEKYDPAGWLGYLRNPGESGWDALATWPDGRVEAALKRLGWRTLLIGGRPRRGVPSLFGTLAQQTSCEIVEWTGLETTVTAVSAKLATYLSDPSIRLVVIAEEAGVLAALRSLALSPEARDRQVAFVSIGGIITGDPEEDGVLGESSCSDWLGANYSHAKLDTEIVRLTPYFSLQWLDRSGDTAALPLGASRFPPPREDPGAMPMIESVDLGPLPADPDLPLEQVARSVRVLTSCWALSRSGLR